MTLSQALALEGVTISDASGIPIVEKVTLSALQGQILGVVGESGAGKTTVGISALGYVQRGTQIISGSLQLDGSDYELSNDSALLRRQRGSVVAYVPQEPAASLNPATRVGDAVAALRREHGLKTSRREIADLFTTVQLRSDEEFLRRYPHELSGGQQQRVCLAVALACEPRVLVLDEITTGLDVVTQKSLLEEIRRLTREKGLAAIYVTHDLAVVADLADMVAVMYAGEVVEYGPTLRVLTTPHHPYTRALIQAAPDHQAPTLVAPIEGIAPSLAARTTQIGCRFAPRCPLVTDDCRLQPITLHDTGDGSQSRCIRWQDTPRPAQATRRPKDEQREGTGTQSELQIDGLIASHKGKRGVQVVARDVTFQIATGTCVALVGESGSGKTTVARCIVGLHAPESGEIRLNGTPLAPLARQRSVAERRDLQIVFQNPRGALNPHHRIGEIIGRPCTTLRDLHGKQLQAEVLRLLDEVRLPTNTVNKFPSELSGGERQRVGIARALATNPRFLICDEVTSALDVSIQAAILTLLRELSTDRGVGILMITHDLGVVASIAHEVLVLEKGEICEHATVEALLAHPQQPYTRTLLSAAPRSPLQYQR